MAEDFRGLVIRGVTRTGSLVMGIQDETDRTSIQHRNLLWMQPETPASKAVERKTVYSQTS